MIYEYYEGEHLSFAIPLKDETGAAVTGATLIARITSGEDVRRGGTSEIQLEESADVLGTYTMEFDGDDWLGYYCMRLYILTDSGYKIVGTESVELIGKRI